MIIEINSWIGVAVVVIVIFILLPEKRRKQIIKHFNVINPSKWFKG